MEGFAVTCPLAPDAPRLISGFCSSPRSFGFDFLQTPPRGDALAVSLAFGSAKTWLPDFHRHSYVPCSAHTLRLSDGPRSGPSAATGCYPDSLLFVSVAFGPAAPGRQWGHAFRWSCFRYKEAKSRLYSCSNSSRWVQR